METENGWVDGTEILCEVLRAYSKRHNLSSISVLLDASGGGHIELDFNVRPDGDRETGPAIYEIGFDCVNMLKLILTHGDPQELAVNQLSD